MELISTYMKHNDRLEVIIESALRPYGLIAQPAPKLSHYMHFDTLEYWYSNILHAEMRQRIDDVLSVWKDVSKNAGMYGLKSIYNKLVSFKTIALKQAVWPRSTITSYRGYPNGKKDRQESS